MIKIYIDEDAMARSFERGLVVRGYDVLTSLKAGMNGRSDNEQLEFAVSEQRAIYTFNIGDFVKLHNAYLAANKTHFGILLEPRNDFVIGKRLQRFIDVINAYSGHNSNLKNLLIYL